MSKTSMPTVINSRRKKQIEDFFDKERSVMHNYYDLLERKLSSKQLKIEMERLIKVDPDFYDSYIILADILKHQGKIKEARKFLKTAYERALKRIVDESGNFPKKIEWGWLENRHLVRAVESWGFELWEQNKTEEALGIFRRLLKSNPNDNIGARHNILAILLGLNPNYERKFEVKDVPGCLNGYKLSQWFTEHSKDFMDEFSWWFKKVKHPHHKLIKPPQK
ncbi:MAG: hypothetical protein KJ597_05375 [Nanoarchaeota archaeon]|nr:hypothetical protein [Nanoarchaeota archaeon]MBU1622976.1 hypothetical protein [Nanoarchaeota archaeon]